MINLHWLVEINPMITPIVDIVIPVHNRRAITQDCLSSLFKQIYTNYKVIVIDDGSTDGTAAMIAEQFPQVTVLRGDGNLWWSRATNMGVEHALNDGAEYILTLNDDTIAPPDFLENMMRWAQKTPNALLGAYAIDAVTGSPVYGGEIINWITASSVSLLDRLSAEKRVGLHRVTHFPGRGLLIPAEVFRRIGDFDAKRFPQLAADYDFTHRAIRAGYLVFCNYDAKLLIYPMASQDAMNRQKKNFTKYYNHLFGFKGGGNLLRFWRYALRNCPKERLLFFIIIGSVRRIFGYLFDWIAIKKLNT